MILEGCQHLPLVQQNFFNRCHSCCCCCWAQPAQRYSYMAWYCPLWTKPARVFSKNPHTIKRSYILYVASQFLPLPIWDFGSRTQRSSTDINYHNPSITTFNSHPPLASYTIITAIYSQSLLLVTISISYYYHSSQLPLATKFWPKYAILKINSLK